MSDSIIKIKGLKCEIEGKGILNGVDLEVKKGEVHAIMGPNGSGKSTLSSVLAGREEYEVTGGSVDYFGKDLLEMSPEERAWEGVFLAFQYPVEIPGVSNINFLRTALSERNKFNGQDAISAKDFFKMVKDKSSLGIKDRNDKVLVKKGTKLTPKKISSFNFESLLFCGSPIYF